LGGIGTASGTGGEVNRAPANLFSLSVKPEEENRSLSEPELSEPDVEAERTFIFLL
jgi:hypothetical protein